MSSILALGWGAVAGSLASPQTLLDAVADGGGAFGASVANTDATNWLFLKIANSSHPPLVANGSNTVNVPAWDIEIADPA